MPVGQSVLYTNYKNFFLNNANVNLDKTTLIIMIRTVAIISAQRTRLHKIGQLQTIITSHDTNMRERERERLTPRQTDRRNFFFFFYNAVLLHKLSSRLLLINR